LIEAADRGRHLLRVNLRKVGKNGSVSITRSDISNVESDAKELGGS
jgi:hypothetical protein